MSATTPPITPYHPPTSPSQTTHVALSSKSFRVFGLNDPAWDNARRDWKRYKSSLGGGNGDGGGGNDGVGNGGNGGGKKLKSAFKHLKNIDQDHNDDDASNSSSSSDEESIHEAKEGAVSKEEEEREELQLICNAITTALSEDAGGFGTAGFHVTHVNNVQQTKDTAVYNATIIPYDSNLNEPITNPKESICSWDAETGAVKYVGNDEFYLNQCEEVGGVVDYPQFQIRINISKATEGLAAKKLHDKLFYKRKELAMQNKGSGSEDVAQDEKELDVDAWIAQDEELAQLQQNLIDAQHQQQQQHGGENGKSTEGGGALGYYVEMMLLEPHIGPDEIVISPPMDLDKSQLTSKPTTGKGSRQEEEDAKIRSGGSIYHKDIFASRQFTSAGPWERTNIKAFGDMALDVRKALVRVEFPVFPEGCKEKTFKETYQLNARLKSGSFATVCRGTHRATGKKIAVKCVLRKDLPPSDDAAIYDEVLILSTLRHRFICPLIDFFEERECYFLIMELMSGGDLFDRIGKRKNYTEVDARDLCRKMLESVRYCHENSVAHCDMKPKNLLLVDEDDDVSMKLADFGFATRVYEPESLTKQCGTPFFVAPEVLMRSPYDQQSDMWSCGVIMFLLLGGDLPFMGRSQKELFRNIVMGRYEMSEEGWSGVSEDAKDLVKKLLVTDPSKRLTSREAMASPWLRARGDRLSRNSLMYTSQRLKGFNARMKLRASMIAVGSVVSLRLSVSASKSARMLAAGNKTDSSGSSTPASSGAPAAKRASFLRNLPDEEIEEEEDDDVYDDV